MQQFCITKIFISKGYVLELIDLENMINPKVNRRILL